jgi:hypothetical protein
MKLNVTDNWTNMDNVNLEVNNTKWNIQYSSLNLNRAVSDDAMKVKMAREGDRMVTGGFYRNAEIARGGLYKVKHLV